MHSLSKSLDSLGTEKNIEEISGFLKGDNHLFADTRIPLQCLCSLLKAAHEFPICSAMRRVTTTQPRFPGLGGGWAEGWAVHSLIVHSFYNI